MPKAGRSNPVLSKVRADAFNQKLKTQREASKALAEKNATRQSAIARRLKKA